MGLFTFTFANYDNEKKLGYGYRGYIACPDGTFICETYYCGYGIFNGKDVYALVVDWNKDDLIEILKRKNSNLLPVAEAFVKGLSEDLIEKEFGKVIGFNSLPLSDWKRNIGIDISCDDNDNALLKYPIKIVSNKKCNYADLPASKSTQ